MIETQPLLSEAIIHWSIVMLMILQIEFFADHYDSHSKMILTVSSRLYYEDLVQRCRFVLAKQHMRFCGHRLKKNSFACSTKNSHLIEIA